MKRYILYITAFLLVLCSGFFGASLAHESQPGLLEMRQLNASRYEVIWRAPIYYGKPHPARLQLPEEWKIVGESTVRQLPDSALHRRVVEVPGDSINGSIIRFPGLEETITDVFVRISRLDGSESTLVVRPPQPYTELRGERPWYVSSGEYMTLGLHHILMGIDHLLFVLGLLIIVSGRQTLVKTITAFTVAHSILLLPLPPWAMQVFPRRPSMQRSRCLSFSWARRSSACGAARPVLPSGTPGWWPLVSDCCMASALPRSDHRGYAHGRNSPGASDV